LLDLRSSEWRARAVLRLQRRSGRKRERREIRGRRGRGVADQSSADTETAPSDDSATDASGDAGAASDVAVDAPFEAGPGCSATQFSPTCNAPTQCGPVVQPTEVLQTPPVPLGGTIAPGLYLLTKFNVYRMQSGGPLNTIQLTAYLTANTYANHIYVSGQEQPPESGTYATSGTTFTRNFACPNSFSVSDQYTANSSTLIIYQLSSQGTFEYIETK
jgi:hypothetical protein